MGELFRNYKITCLLSRSKLPLTLHLLLLDNMLHLLPPEVVLLILGGGLEGHSRGRAP